MDLDVMASVQDEHHRQLPLRARRLDGDAGRLDDQALPAGVRGTHASGPRMTAERARSPRSSTSPCRPRARRLMADRHWITFTVDGREVRAPEGEWLLDAVKRGDVEVPFFCYEPKLGAPVGACRMCLVEIEGIPKLQTSCSTPVKDGMVVYTQTDRVKHAQNAVVEFLLVNHPLDCPVCDKGGECPLQDISYGWGPGRSRFDRAEAQLPEADRAVAAGRDRPRALHPLLPLRAVLAGGRRGLPARLPRARRPHLRRHLRRPPLRGAVLRATSSSCARWARSPRPPTGSAPGPGTSRTRARSARSARASATSPSPSATSASSACSPATTTQVDDGWLCDKGRWGYQSVALRRARSSAAGARRRHAAPGELGARARGGRRQACARPARRRPRSSAGRPRTRRATCSSASSARRSARRNVDSRAGGALEPARRGCSRTRTWPRRWPTSTAPRCVLVLETDPINEAPIIDLRLRKAVRRFGARLVVAASAPDRARRRAPPSA